ncbi:MAG: hypothetical protein ACRDT2_03380 [Natronosporangium sp.]
MILIGEHTPHRPDWLCRRCHQPYPCPEGRSRLTQAHRRTGELGLIAYELLEQAVRDLPDLPVAGLWERFVAWTEPARLS